MACRINEALRPAYAAVMPSVFTRLTITLTALGRFTPGLRVAKSCRRTLARSIGWMMLLAKQALRPPHAKGCIVSANVCLLSTILSLEAAITLMGMRRLSAEKMVVQ